MRGDSVLPNECLEQDEECPKLRLVLGDKILAIWPIVRQNLLKGAQTCFQLPIHWDVKSKRLHFQNPPSRNPEIHLPSKSTDLIVQVGGSAAIRSFLVEPSCGGGWICIDLWVQYVTTYNAVQMGWLAVPLNGWQWEGRMAGLECLYTNREVISGWHLVYFIGDRKMNGKYWVKTWMDILAEICHPGSPQMNLSQEDSREMKGEVEWERVRETERERGERERERKEIFIQQGTISLKEGV